MAFAILAAFNRAARAAGLAAPQSSRPSTVRRYGTRGHRTLRRGFSSVLASPGAFTEEQFDGLAAKLEQRAAGIRDILELEGFLTAVIIGPYLLCPSVWLAEVWGAGIPSGDDAEFDRVSALVMAYHNAIAGQFHHAPDQFEPTFHETNLDDVPVPVIDGWCAGFLRGMSMDAAAWEAMLQSRPDLLKLVKLLGSSSDYKHKAPRNGRSHLELPIRLGFAVRAIHAFWLPRRHAQKNSSL